MDERSGRTPTRRGASVRLGAVIALGLAVAFIVWLVVRDRSGSDSGSPTSTPTTTTTGARPVVLPANVQGLKTLARLTEHPIYWAGPRRRTKYELTQASDGRIYIRYLPRNVAIGDRRGRFLIVATYPLVDGYKAVQTAAASQGGHQFAIARGGLAVWNDSSPTNVYFAYPGAPYQVEVYHPNAARARALVRGGRIRPIR